MIAAAPPHLPAYFAYFCATQGEKTFIVDGDTRLSFADVYKAARHVAGGLVEGLGLRKGERVGIAARNSANWVVAYMAVLMAGGCATLLNGWWQGEELAHGIDLVDYPQLNDADRQWIEHYYRANVRPVLTPLGIDPSHPFPQLLNKSLNIVVQLEIEQHGEIERRLAVVQVPSVLPRLVHLRRRRSVVALVGEHRRLGQADERLGERICAVVVPMNDPIELHSLQEWLLERGLSRRHLPESLVIVDDVPVTAAGKIRKLDLKKLLEAAR